MLIVLDMLIIINYSNLIKSKFLLKLMCWQTCFYRSHQQRSSLLSAITYAAYFMHHTQLVQVQVYSLNFAYNDIVLVNSRCVSLQGKWLRIYLNGNIFEYFNRTKVTCGFVRQSNPKKEWIVYLNEYFDM